MNNNKNFYIYVGQDEEPYGPWAMIPDEPEKRQRAINAGYTAGSVISLYFGAIKGSPLETRGPLFIEFEAKREPSIAISIAREFIRQKLVDHCAVDPGCLRYWMNGSKGCHIEIPWVVYGEGEWQRDCPPVEYDILLQLGFHAFDDSELRFFANSPQFYFAKVLMVQWPNIKRNNGHFKVPVSAEEFFNHDYSELERLTLTPRIDFDPGTTEPIKSPRLAEICDIAVGWRRRGRNGLSPLSGM